MTMSSLAFLWQTAQVIVSLTAENTRWAGPRLSEKLHLSEKCEDTSPFSSSYFCACVTWGILHEDINLDVLDEVWHDLFRMVCVFESCMLPANILWHKPPKVAVPKCFILIAKHILLACVTWVLRTLRVLYKN